MIPRDDLRALAQKWRERERVWLHKADTSKTIMYADRCSGLAEIYASCADELFALAAAQETPQGDIERKYRHLLWRGHGCTAALYGDDGEMQCNDIQRHGMLDFKRDTLKRLEEKLAEMHLRVLAQETPATRPAEDEEPLCPRCDQQRPRLTGTGRYQVCLDCGYEQPRITSEGPPR